MITQKLLPFINNNGRIINISSATTRFVIPGYAVYASLKGAVEIFTKYLAKEIGVRGITVNVVAPGAVETDFNGGVLKNNQQIKQFLSQQTALGRVAQPDDISGVVCFLCSDEARWVTAQRIEVSGGAFLQE